MNMTLPRVARSVLIFTLEMLEVGAKADAQWDEAAAEISPALDEPAVMAAAVEAVPAVDQALKDATDYIGEAVGHNLGR